VIENAAAFCAGARGGRRDRCLCRLTTSPRRPPAPKMFANVREEQRIIPGQDSAVRVTAATLSSSLAKRTACSRMAAAVAVDGSASDVV